MEFKTSGIVNALNRINANLSLNIKTTFDTLYFALTNLDTDGTLAANSDSKVATQKATKKYIDDGKNSETYFGNSATPITTTSGSLVQISSAQVTITTKGGKVLVIGTAPISMSVGTVNAYLGLIVDGVAHASTVAFISTSARPVIIINSLTLAAGSHTIKLAWKIDGGNTATISAYNSFEISASEI